MAKVTTELKVLVKTAGDAGLDKLTRTLNGLGRQAKSAAAPFDQISKELKEVQRTSKNSIANLRGYRNAWRDITQQVEIGSTAFKEATAEAARLDRQLQKAEGRKGPSRGGRLRAAAQIAGTVAGAGVFGGPEGAAGALLGSIGGPGGAIVGGAIGAQVGQLRQALGATAEYAASLSKLRIALRGVTTSAVEYQQSLAFIQKSTETFALPQEIITRQFTKLQASVQGAGGNLEDTKTAFNGIVAAVRATGGSLQDIDSALTATSQVFSKGKVSAEELRQQIGERLPGAFTLFAESIGKTPQELDKALEKGQVSLQDFLTFTKSIFERYGENAAVIATGPEAAGDRLKVALEQLSETTGQLLAPIGAFFQNTFTQIANSITIASKALIDFFSIGDEKRKDKLLVLLNANKEAIERTKKQITDMEKEITEKGDFGNQRAAIIRNAQVLLDEQQRKQRGFASELNEIIDRLTRDQILIAQPEAQGGLPGIIPGGTGGTDDPERKANLNAADRALLRTGEVMKMLDGLREENRLLNATLEGKREEVELEIRIDNLTQGLGPKLSEHVEQILRGNAAIQDRINNQEDLNNKTDKYKITLDQVKDTLANQMTSAIQGLIDGTKTLGESLSGVLRTFASMFLKAGMGSFVDSIFPSANGNVYANNKIVPFASGGVVNKPTIFPMANGMGLMGEAGPEAIMPLRRGANGKLGVESSGGASNVVVNVDASGSSVEGNGDQAAQLGKAIGIAVQQELIKQKRPGGLLTS